jgi:AcrR family transcriptional regulator
LGDATQRRAIGRPRSIDRDKIVAAATEIGVERLTMRAVAEHLGVTTQALYNHIGGRRELLALLANDYGDAFDFPPEGEADWRPWLSAFARSLRSRLLTRPGTAASVATRGPTSAAAVRFVDQTIARMRRDGFEEQEALLAYKAVLELVVGMAQRQEQRDADPEREQAHRSLFYEALTDSEPDELPNLAFIAAGWNRRDPDELFEYSLACVVAGIAGERGWLGRARGEIARPPTQG